jgi:hypothetical protein
METSEEDARDVAEAVGNHRAVGYFEIERPADQVLRHIEELLGQGHQVGGGQAAMAFVHRFGQRIGDASTHPDHGRLFDAELHGDGVCRLEADAADVAGQPVGVFRHDLDGVGAVGPVDAHCPRRADPVAMQEHHDLTDDLLLSPGNSDRARPHRTDAVHLPQAVRLGLDDVEHLVPEGAQQFLGIDRADAPFPRRGTSRCLRRKWARRSSETGP